MCVHVFVFMCVCVCVRARVCVSQVIIMSIASAFGIISCYAMTMVLYKQFASSSSDTDIKSA